MWIWFVLGLVAGVAATVPVAILVARRTERRVRRLEQRARSAERLAELGTLTSGLAHEIKNPLSTVGLNMQLIQEDLTDLTHDAHPGALPDDRLNRLQRRFESLKGETGRLREILEDFLRFAGRIQLDCAEIDLGALIAELVDFFEPQANESGVQIRTQLSTTPTIHADAAQLKQALLNLFINATWTMQNARSRSDGLHGGANELMIRTESGRGELRIHVIDTGPGIETEAIDKIFSPYYSTRPGGTGLGLSVTRRIVEEHGGTLSVHSEPARGSDFCLTLPLNPPDEGASAVEG